MNRGWRGSLYSPRPRSRFILAHGTLSARLQETQRELAYRRQADHIEVTLPEQVRRIEGRISKVYVRSRSVSW